MNSFRFFSRLLFIFLTCISIQGVAQKSIKEGTVVYEISYPDMELDKQMAGMLPTESVVVFKPGHSRTDIPMGMGMKTATVVNSKTGQVITMTDFMGTRTAVVVNDGKTKSRKQDKVKVVVSDETKVIAGYSCKKALVTVDEKTTIEVYCTDAIEATSAASNDWEGLNGFPMEFVMEMSGFRMKMTARTVEAGSIDDGNFEIPEGYKIMTQEEYLKMMENFK